MAEQKYDAVHLDAASRKTYNNLIALYGLEGVQHIVVDMNLQVTQERRRRARMEKKK